MTAEKRSMFIHVCAHLLKCVEGHIHCRDTCRHLCVFILPFYKEGTCSLLAKNTCEMFSSCSGGHL